MPWTRFLDMHSGGELKQPPYKVVYIEAELEQAKRVFYHRFSHNPDRVTCTCCGPDYNVDESPTIEEATEYDRNPGYGDPKTMEQLKSDGEHLFIPADLIGSDEKYGDLPEGGYVWKGSKWPKK